MPKKGQPLSEEQKAKMKAGREAKKINPQTPDQSKSEPESTILSSQIDDLRRQIEELKQAGFGQQPPTQTPGFGMGGELIGTFEKYIVDPLNYPDPTSRIYAEPRLKRFAFADNYFLIWKIETSQYQTIDQRNVKEPKFTLELWVNRFDEDGEPMKGKEGGVVRYKMKDWIFHEDPQAAIVIAREQGVDVNEWNDSTIDRTQKAFLDEMRYFRIRDGVLDSFFPKVSQGTKRRREEVIGNQLVEVREFSSDDLRMAQFEDM